MAITQADFNRIWASTSPLTPYDFSESNYKEGWNFIGGTPPSRQMWDFLQKNNDEKSQWLYNNKLDLSGGTMTGAINGNPLTLTAEDENNTSSLVLGADGSLALDGKSLSNVPDMNVFLNDSDFVGVTAFNSRVTNITGGYKQIGNIVYVSVRFKPTTLLNGVGVWVLMSGFPLPSMTVALPFCAELSDADSIKFVWAKIGGGTGYLSMALNASLTADTVPSHTVLVQGFYFAAPQ